MIETVRYSPNLGTKVVNRLIEQGAELARPSSLVKWLRENKYPILALDLDALPKEIVDTPEFQQAMDEDRESYEVQRGHYLQVRDAWEELGIPCFMIKTACVPPTFPYTSDNLDILVPWERADEAKSALLELGFLELRNIEEQNKFLFRKFHDGKSVAAIHVHRWVGWNLNFFEENILWDRARVSPDDPSILAPSPEDALLINIAHAYFENKNFNLHDLEKMRVNWQNHELDWDYLDKVPKRRGWYDAFLFGILLAAHLEERLTGSTAVPQSHREQWEIELRKYPRVYLYYQKETQRPADLPFRMSFMFSKRLYYQKVWRDTHDSVYRKIRNTVRTLVWGFRLKSKIRPNHGAVVAFSGLDGSGKTLQAENLCRVLEISEIPYTHYWNRVGYSPLTRLMTRIFSRTDRSQDPNSISPIEGQNDLSRWPGPVQAIWAWFLAMDLLVRYTVRVRVPVWRSHFGIGKVVVCDRYVLDAATEILTRLPKGGWMVRAAVKVLKALSPRPNVAFLLDVPEEVAQVRHELPVSIDTLRRYRGLHNTLASEYGAKVLDGTRDAVSLGDELAEDVVRDFEARYPTWLNALLLYNPSQLNPNGVSQEK